MMKKLTKTLLICLVLATILCTAVSADVIWEPYGDSFYDKHVEDMQHEGRHYYANGQSGYMEIFAEPNGKGIGFAENSEIFTIQFTYKSDWGMLVHSEDGEFLTGDWTDENVGYVRMEDMLQVYDSMSFCDEHESELSDYNGDFSTYEGNLVFWTYPASGVVEHEFEASSQNTENLSFSELYTDENGLEWARVGYFNGIRDLWVCITEPSSTDLPANPEPIPEFHQASSETPPELSGEGSGNIIIIAIVLVAGVGIISAILIIVFKKKRKS